jgi:hypothetical protein
LQWLAGCAFAGTKALPNLPTKARLPDSPKNLALQPAVIKLEETKEFFCEMNFIRRILKPYTTGTSSIDLTSTPGHLSIDPVSTEELNTIDPMSAVADLSAMDVKMEMEIKREVLNGNLHDIPALVDKRQRKAAKKQRRKDARMGKERLVWGGKSSGVREGNGAQRKNDGPNGAAVAVMIKRKQKKRAKKERKREAAAKQVQTNIAEPSEEITALYAVPHHL